MTLPQTVFIVTWKTQLRAFANREAAQAYLRSGGIAMIDNSVMVDHSRYKLYDKLWWRWAEDKPGPVDPFRDYTFLSPPLKDEDLA